MPFLAATIINNVRDIYPDPAYSAGVPQPDADGPIFRAGSLYRWLDDGARLMVSRTGWTLTDWTAFPAVANKAIYNVSELWQIIDQVYASRFPCQVISRAEARAVTPNAASGLQPKDAYVHSQGGGLALGFDPFPSASDPATTLNGALTIGAVSIVLTSAAGFLPSGYALIDSELVFYQAIVGNTLTLVARGVGGTAAAAHLTAAAATHCSLWVQGARVPNTISSSTSLVEVPLAWVSLLNLYLLGMMKMSGQDEAAATKLLDLFEKGCAAIAKQVGGRDPIVRRLGDDRQSGGVPPPMVSEPAQIQSSG